MPERRLIGIWVVAIYFFAKAGFVCALAAAIAHAPDDAAGQVSTLRELLPLIQRIDAGPLVSVAIAIILAAFGTVVGICILARQKWAAAYVVIYHGLALIWFLLVTLGFQVIGLDTGSALLSSPWFKVELVSSLLMVGYMVQPRVMRSFGFSLLRH